jgi:gluconate 2-dehydrogenase gamma chain
VVNRRELLVGSAAAGAALMSGCFSRRTPWEFLTADEAKTLAALCDQIIPADDFPGASEAGAVTFIDRQLVRHYQSNQQAYREGLKLADEISRSRFGADLAAATPLQQLEMAKAIEKQAPDFFELVRRHTLQGYYGSPRHGGNRDAASWRMLGLDEPPLRGRAQYDLTKIELTAGPKP